MKFVKCGQKLSLQSCSFLDNFRGDPCRSQESSKHNMAVATNARLQKLEGHVLASTGARGGVVPWISFQSLLEQVVARAQGQQKGGKCAHFLTGEEGATFGNMEELTRSQSGYLSGKIHPLFLLVCDNIRLYIVINAESETMVSSHCMETCA